MQVNKVVRFDKQLLDYITQGPFDKAISMLNVSLCKVSDDWGTLLHYAALGNQHATAQHLLELGCDVDYPTRNFKKTPLMVAIEEKSVKAALILLRARANLYVKDANNVSALQMAFDVNNYVNDLVIRAVNIRLLEENLKTEELVKRLLEAKCSLYLAALLRKVDVVKRMLDHGIDVNSEGYLGRTALLVATRLNDVQMVKMLLERGANVNLYGHESTAPLLLAAWHGNAEIVKLLLQKRADPNVEDRRTGHSPLSLAFSNSTTAKEKQFDDCAELLLRYGARPRSAVNNYQALFDHAVSKRSLNKVKLLFAHMAITDMKYGSSVIEKIVRCNDGCNHCPKILKFRNYYHKCKNFLKITVVRSVTVLSLITHSEHKLRTYVRHEKLDTNLSNIYSTHKLSENCPLYYNILTERVSRAIRMANLENNAIPIVSRILNAKFNETRGDSLVIAESTVKYLNEYDMAVLCQVRDTTKD